MISLKDKVVVVVGAGSGIGQAAAELAAELGARVAVIDRDATGEKVAATIVGEAARFIQCDATDGEAVNAAIAQAVETFGGIDAVITTVGGAHLAPVAETSIADWESELRFNLTSAFLVAKASAPHLVKRGGGAIVTTSSGYAVIPGPDRIGYTASKAGVIALTRSLAADLAKQKIRVNCIAPGPTDTPRFRAMNGGDAGVERVRKNMPLGEIPLPIDCANAAIFLISDAASQITGQVLHVNGGLIMP